MPPFSTTEQIKLRLPDDQWKRASPVVEVLGRNGSEVDSLNAHDKNNLSGTIHFGRWDNLRKVSFCPQVKVKKIPCRKVFTPEEIAQAWMTWTDYQQTRHEAMVTFLLLDQGRSISNEDRERCATGIDSKTRYRQRKRTHKNAVRTVLFEQKTQRAGGYRCEDLIAMSYMEHTEEPQNRAYLAGVMMALQVKN